MAAILSLTVFRLTFRVAEPEGLARRLPPLANGVTDQGLGGVSAANEAGNAVLGDVGFCLRVRLQTQLHRTLLVFPIYPPVSTLPSFAT
jgi:hypothetical protein